MHQDDSYITAITQLTQIQNRYNAHKKLALLPPKEGNTREFSFKNCKCHPNCAIDKSSDSSHNPLPDPVSVLCFPCITNPAIPTGLRSKIRATLATRFNTSPTIIGRHFSEEEVELWGRLRLLGGGDTIRATSVGLSNAEDRWDVSYVRVCPPLLLVKFCSS